MQVAIKEFWSQKRYAVVGVSRRREKFGNALFREMKKKGMDVCPVNSHADIIEGEKAYSTLKQIHDKPDAVIIVVPPRETDAVLRQCANCGISHVWIQQGAESDRSQEIAQELGIKTITHECALMFLEPVRFPHSFHGWLHRRFAKHHGS